MRTGRDNDEVEEADRSHAAVLMLSSGRRRGAGPIFSRQGEVDLAAFA